MMPRWETHIWHHTISWNILIPGVVIPGLMFNLIAMYPAIEAWVEKDSKYHNLLDRPRDKPVRTALGVTSLTFYMVLVIAGANDILANTFHWSLQATTWVLRVMIIVLPPISYKITKRVCLGLQHEDAKKLHHGVETGIIRRLPSGAYIEVEEPLPASQAETLRSVTTGTATGTPRSPARTVTVRTGTVRTVLARTGTSRRSRTRSPARPAYSRRCTAGSRSSGTRLVRTSRIPRSMPPSKARTSTTRRSGKRCGRR
jgi:ubiquinol-cytochrome c reductase cytochrome b subunit